MIANDFVDQLDLDLRFVTMKHQMIANGQSNCMAYKNKNLSKQFAPAKSARCRNQADRCFTYLSISIFLQPYTLISFNKKN